LDVAEVLISAGDNPWSSMRLVRDLYTAYFLATFHKFIVHGRADGVRMGTVVEDSLILQNTVRTWAPSTWKTIYAVNNAAAARALQGADQDPVKLLS